MPRAESTSSASAIGTILKAGLIAGTCDAIAASTQFIIMTQKNPIRVWNYVASAALGKNPDPGPLTAIAGIFFHYCIATGWATVFYLAYPAIRRVSRNWILNGLVYAVFVWTIMSLIVVPNSRIGTPFKFVPMNAAISCGILMLCIGLPISFIVSRARGSETASRRAPSESAAGAHSGG